MASKRMHTLRGTILLSFTGSTNNIIASRNTEVSVLIAAVMMVIIKSNDNDNDNDNDDSNTTNHHYLF